MTFFYDLNKKLADISAKPETKQLNERADNKAVAEDFGATAAIAGGAALGSALGAVKGRYDDMKQRERGATFYTPKSEIDKPRTAWQRTRAAAGFPSKNDPNVKTNEEAMEEGSTGDYSAKKARAGKDIGKPGKAFAKIAKSAGERYGSKERGEKVAGAVLAKLRGKNESVAESDMDEGMLDSLKNVGKKIAGGINRAVGHGSDEQMRADLQKKMGLPPTGKKPQTVAFHKSNTVDDNAVVGKVKEEYGPLESASGTPMTPKQKKFAKLAPPADKITFADKIAGAKKEVDEMLGDVAANAMRKAVKGKKVADEGSDWSQLGKEYSKPKVGTVTHGAKHDIEQTATGQRVTRRVDPNTGHSVGAEDDKPMDGEKRGRGRPKKADRAPERVTAKAYKHKGGRKVAEDGSHGQAQQIYDELADIRAVAKQAQRGGQFPQGYASRVESALWAAMTLIKNQQPANAQVSEEELDEKAVSKAQQRFMGMVHATQKGEKAPSKEVAKVAKTMKKKDAEDFAATKHKGLPEKKKPEGKKKEKTEEAGGSGTPTASSGFSFGKGIYDSMNRELENMIAENMALTVAEGMGDDIVRMQYDKLVKKGYTPEQAIMDIATRYKDNPEDIRRLVAVAEGMGDDIVRMQYDNLVSRDGYTPEQAIMDIATRYKHNPEDIRRLVSGSTAQTPAARSAGVMKQARQSLGAMHEGLNESMSINMSDSTEGGKSLTITATDDDAMKLADILRNAGLGGGADHEHPGAIEISGSMDADGAEELAHELRAAETGTHSPISGDEGHDHGEPCETCGSADCGCGDVEEALAENEPDWPTDEVVSDDALQYSGGLNGPKSTGQTTVPVIANQGDRTGIDDEALRRLREAAGIAEQVREDAEAGNKEALAKDIYDLAMSIHTNDRMYAHDSPEDNARLKQLKAQFAQQFPGEDAFKIGSAINDREYAARQNQQNIQHQQDQEVAARTSNVMQKAKRGLGGMYEQEQVMAPESIDEAKEMCEVCEATPCKCDESVEESIARFRRLAGIQEAAKPDYIDLDKDGDKKESMKKAADDKEKEDKKVAESIFRMTNLWKAYKG